MWVTGQVVQLGIPAAAISQTVVMTSTEASGCVSTDEPDFHLDLHLFFSLPFFMLDSEQSVNAFPLVRFCLLCNFTKPNNYERQNKMFTSSTNKWDTGKENISLCIPAICI